MKQVTLYSGRTSPVITASGMKIDRRGNAQHENHDKYKTKSAKINHMGAPALIAYVRIHSGNPEAMAVRTACISSSRVANSAGSIGG